MNKQETVDFLTKMHDILTSPIPNAKDAIMNMAVKLGSLEGRFLIVEYMLKAKIKSENKK